MNRIPVIHNVSLLMLNYNSSIINGTCNECLCTMLLNITLIFSFNCFQNNKTCEIFSKSLNTNSFWLINNTASSVYFISLPTSNSITTVASTAQNTSNLTTASTTSLLTSSISPTSSSSTTTITTTTQSTQIGYDDDSSATSNAWTQRTSSYSTTVSKNLTLQFTFRTNNKCTWYIDDVSVLDPSLTQMLTNRGFENSSLPVGWTTNSSTCSTPEFGVSTSQPHVSTRSFCDTCDSKVVSIFQSFPAIGSQIYSISYWYYFTCSNTNGSPGPIEMIVILN